MPKQLSYVILSTSSRDKEKEKELGVDYEDCWVTDKNRSYPQSMVLQLKEETYVHSVRIVAHKDYPPSSLTVSLGLPDGRFSNSIGKSYSADYSTRQELSFNEHFTRIEHHPTSTAHFGSNGLFVRITIHGFIHSTDNIYRQVALLSVLCLKRALLEEDSVYSNSEVYPPSATQPDELPMQVASFDEAALLPLRRPERTAMPRKPDFRVFALDSDSDDEVVIFTRDMIERIQKKNTPLTSPKPHEEEKKEERRIEKKASTPSPPLSGR